VSSPAKPPAAPEAINSLVDAVLEEGRSEDALLLLLNVADSALSKEDREALDALGPDLVRQLVADQQEAEAGGPRAPVTRAEPPEPGRRGETQRQMVLEARPALVDAGTRDQAPSLAGPSWQPGPASVPDATQRSGDGESRGAVRPWLDAVAPPERMPQVPGYEVLGCLGSGGMGVVYKARHTDLGRVVALKCIRPDGYATARELGRFRREAEAIARLQHPNIVHVYDVGAHDGLPYFSLEFCAGGSLADKLNRTPQPPLQAAQLVEVLAGGIQAAHACGIVHRDLKPGNVLLTADGTPKITDFGLAKRLEGDVGQTQSGVILGTPSYMAPEQAEGNARTIGPAADVYSLGAILYECLTGRPPFKAPTLVGTLEQVRSVEPPPPGRLQPKVPPDLETICLKCLQKDPHKRYASAASLAQDLQRFLKGEPIRARPSPPWERALKWGRRHPAAAGMVVLNSLWLLLLLYMVLALSRWQARCNGLSEDLAQARRDNEALQGQPRQAAGEHEPPAARLEHLRALLAGREGAPPGVLWLTHQPPLQRDLDRLRELLARAAEQANHGGTDDHTLAEITNAVDRLRGQFAALLENPTEASPPSLREELDVRDFFNQVEKLVLLLRGSGRDEG
jgi:serine/threonine protein kinase